MLSIHVVEPEDWHRARDLRLEMLADTPIAFVGTLAEAEARTDAEWKQRHQARLGTDHHAVVVVDENGLWRGHMGVVVQTSPRRAWLVAVWVHPDFRGDHLGAAAMLLEEITAWVRQRGLDELWLEVHEANDRAIAFYRKSGFEMTGERRPYPLDHTASELAMRRLLLR